MANTRQSLHFIGDVLLRTSAILVGIVAIAIAWLAFIIVQAPQSAPATYQPYQLRAQYQPKAGSGPWDSAPPQPSLIDEPVLAGAELAYQQRIIPYLDDYTPHPPEGGARALADWKAGSPVRAEAQAWCVERVRRLPYVSHDEASAIVATATQQLNVRGGGIVLEALAPVSGDTEHDNMQRRRCAALLYLTTLNY